MHKYLKLFAPVILSLYFCVFIAGAGWGEDKILYHSDSLPLVQSTLSSSMEPNQELTAASSEAARIEAIKIKYTGYEKRDPWIAGMLSSVFFLPLGYYYAGEPGKVDDAYARYFGVGILSTLLGIIVVVAGGVNADNMKIGGYFAGAMVLGVIAYNIYEPIQLVNENNVNYDKAIKDGIIKPNSNQQVNNTQ